MDPIDIPSPDAQRLQSLRDTRQRIVELQAVRSYLQESHDASALLADLDSKLGEALTLEQRLIELAPRKPARSRRGRASPLLAASVFVLSMAEDGVLAVLELVSNLSFAM